MTIIDSFIIITLLLSIQMTESIYDKASFLQRYLNII
jgi:hypothetical protein